MKNTVKWGIAALSIFLLGLVSGQALAGPMHMRTALGALNTAEAELKAATDNKGGHRAKALALVLKAQIEVRAGMGLK